MNKHIHNAILHLAKAMLCAVMIILLSILLTIATYPSLVMGVMLFITVLLVMTSAQLGYFVGNVMRGNNNETR